MVSLMKTAIAVQNHLLLTGHESYDSYIYEFTSARPISWVLVIFFGEVDDLGLIRCRILRDVLVQVIPLVHPAGLQRDHSGARACVHLIYSSFDSYRRRQSALSIRYIYHHG